MKYKTAIEWLEDNLIGNPFSEKDFTNNVKIFKKAKEMEKEQIIRARQDGLDNGFSNGSWDSNLYYNETYKINKL
jgi:hypothetical protein